jgi:hypothetical protein
MNTRLSYRYSDKTNCKQYTSIIIEGTLTWEQVEPYLMLNGFFIPGQIGLEDLQYRSALPGADHPWHQLLPGDFKPTEATPTIAISAEELAQRFAHTIWTPDWRTVIARAPRVEQTAPLQAAAAPISIEATLASRKKPTSKRMPQDMDVKKRM